jgi:hypothetical protein
MIISITVFITGVNRYSEYSIIEASKDHNFVLEKGLFPLEHPNAVRCEINGYTDSEAEIIFVSALDSMRLGSIKVISKVNVFVMPDFYQGNDVIIIYKAHNVKRGWLKLKAKIV